MAIIYFIKKILDLFENNGYSIRRGILRRDPRKLNTDVYADMAELADALDLGSSGRPCRFESCYPHRAAKAVNPRFFSEFKGLRLFCPH